MKKLALVGIAACDLIATASHTALAAPVLLAETSAFFVSDSSDDSDGPIVASDPGILYEAFSTAEDSEGQAVADSFGDTLGGITLFDTYADVSLFDVDFFAPDGGSAGASATFTLTDSLTNTGSSADTAFLSFHIAGWELELGVSDALTSVAVSAEIFVEGDLAWAVKAGIDASDGVGTPFLFGFGPGGLPSQTCFDGEYCEAGSYTGLLDLGLLAPGESVDFTYVLSSSVFIEDILEENFGSAYISDPTEGFFAGVGPIPSSTAVPAPGGLALMGLGMIGLLSLRRKKA